MADSSPEKAGDVAVATAPDDKKVPVAAIAEERAKTRAAKSEAEAAKQELAKLKEGQVPDLDLLNPIIERLAAEAHKKAEEAIAPWREKAERAEMAVKLGLNEPQVAKVVDVRSKNPNLTEAQALLIARSESPDTFPTVQRPAWQQGLHGGFPVTGTSDSRTAPPQDDYTAKMNAATTAAERQHWAEKEILRRYSTSFLRFKGMPS